MTFLRVTISTASSWTRAMSGRSRSSPAAYVRAPCVLVQPRAEIAALHEEAMSSCLVLERATVAVVLGLRSAGVDSRVLKGPAVAHLDYPDPSWRTFGDIDLLVRGDDYDTAVAELGSWGGRRRSHEIRPGFDRRFGKGVCMLGADGIQVDLHRTFATGPFGLTTDLEALFADGDEIVLGGVPVPVLTREHRFLHACHHAVLGDWPPRLVALRDVAQLLLGTDLDADRAVATATSWRAGAVVATAVRSAWSTFELAPTDLSRWASGYVGSRFERRALDAYLGPRRSYARQMVAAVPAVPGIAGKISFVGSLLLADRSYVRRHDGGYAHRVRRAWGSRRASEAR